MNAIAIATKKAKAKEANEGIDMNLMDWLKV
jgi:hypothetical protein